MVEICFANVVRGTGRLAGKTLLQCCPALPYEYVRHRLDSAVKLVAVQADRFVVLGAASLVMGIDAPQEAAISSYAAAS